MDKNVHYVNHEEYIIKSVGTRTSLSFKIQNAIGGNFKPKYNPSVKKEALWK